MTAATNVRRIALTLALVVLPALFIATAGDAAGKADFSVNSAPTSKTVQRGDTASYAVTVAASGGFTGTVGLTAAGLPSSATAAFSPSSVALTQYTTSGVATLNVATNKQLSTGTYSFTVTGTSGKTAHTVTLTLVVQNAQSGSFALAVTPSSVTVSPAQSAVYTVAITRTSFTNGVTLSANGLPTGATASFSPTPATGSSSTLQVTTSAATPSGTYTVGVTGTSGSLTQATSTQLVVAPPPSNAKPFTISGDVPSTSLLSPGVSFPLDLTLTNPNAQSISITNLSVSVGSVTGGSGGCTASDFTVTQFTGTYPLVVPAGAAQSLSSLGVSVSAMPRVGMLDRIVSQDGCKGVRLALAYSGTGQGG